MVTSTFVSELGEPPGLFQCPGIGVELLRNSTATFLGGQNQLPAPGQGKAATQLSPEAK